MTDGAARRELWSAVARALDLRPIGWEEGVLACAGDRGGARVTLRVGVLAPGVPVRLSVAPEPGAPASYLLLPLRAALVPPAATTGDRAFDAKVAIVLGAETVLAWLDARTRTAVADAGGLVAAIDGGTATLERGPAALLGTEDAALDAVDALVEAVRALRVSSETSLVDRYGVDDGAPLVARAVAQRVDATLHRLSAAEIARFGRLVLARGDDLEAVLGPLVAHRPVQEILLAHRPRSPLLFDQSRRAWAAGDPWLAGALFRARVAIGATEDLHDLPGFATLLDDVELEAAVLDADDARPGSVDDLLVQLEPSSKGNLERLVVALSRSGHPRVDRRLKKLLPRDAPRIAPILVRRVRASLDAGREHELEDLGDALWVAPLFEGLLALPDAAAPWLATLKPESDPQQIQLAERLARCPHPRVERRLLDLLEFSTLPVRRAAAAALAETGSGAAIVALEELASGWLVDGELRATARAAAARIRERHAAGGLSFAESGGRLSEVRRPDDAHQRVDASKKGVR